MKILKFFLWYSLASSVVASFSYIKHFSGESAKTTIAAYVGLLVILGILFLFIRKRKRKLKRVKLTADQFFIPLMLRNQKTKRWEDHKPLILNNIDNGVLVIGQPGSGKTKSIISPLINQLVSKHYTGLIYDLKGKLCEEVFSAYLRNPDSPIKPYFVNFYKPESSNRLNPISPKYMHSKAEAMEFMGSLLSNFMNAEEGMKSSDPFWFNAGRTVLTAIAWFLRNKHPDFCTIPHLVAFILAQPPERMIEIIDADPESSRMLNVLKASGQAQDKKLFINIVSTLYTYLTVLDLPELFWILSGDEVDLNVNNPKNPSLLTIANHEPLQKVYSPIVSLICSVTLQRMNQENQLKGAIVFDEFASIKIPGFQRTPETIRSRNVATIVAIHDKQQLVTQYGESIAETISSTLATKFYFKSTNRKTVEDAVALFGKRDQYFQTMNSGNSRGASFKGFNTGKNTGTSETVQQRDYLKVEEITNYERGEFAAIFSDSNFLYTKGSKVKLLEFNPQPLPTGRCSKESIQSNYLKIYRDIESAFITQ